MNVPSACGSHPEASQSEFRARASEPSAWGERAPLPPPPPAPAPRRANPEGAEELRAKIIGFGERSGRKSFYPELREREERLRAVFEGAAIGIGVIDPEGRLQDANRELQDLLGHSAAELRGRPYLSLVHADDRARFAAQQAELLRGATGRAALEVRLVRSDGETIWAQVRASVVTGDDGAPAYVVAATQDVTVRKRSREALEFLSRASVRLATSLDVGGTLRNLAELAVPFLGDFCAISACASDGGREQRLLACADPARQALAEELVAGRALAEAFGAVSGSSRLVADAPGALALEEDPERRDLLRRLGLRSVLAIPLVSEGSRGTLVLATGGSGRRYGPFDLELATEFGHRASLALENATLLLRAREASRLKDEFLAVVSHELRTPLTSILGWMHLIQTKQLDPAVARRGFSVVERNARALAQIIDDLLGISHLRAGKLGVETAVMDLAPLVQSAVDGLTPGAAANQVTLHVECEPGVPPVLGDARRLQQVVWNLVSNAVKYTPERGEVTVRLARAGDAVELTVRDTGCGISPEFLPHVFEPFRQEDGSATRCYGGLGLGLAIVRHLVDMHGGTVRAASGGTGQGACFTVTLPAAGARPAPRRGEDGVPRHEGAGARPPPGERREGHAHVA